MRANNNDKGRSMKISKIIFALLGLTWVFYGAQAEQSYSPYVNQPFPRNVYFGDTHLHTKYSADAGLYGNKRIGPEQAYALAKGEEISAHNGMRVKLSRPLDFLVLSDHAEYLGLVSMLNDADPVALRNPQAKRWYNMLNGGADSARSAFYELLIDITTGNSRIEEPSIQKTVWGRQIAAAEQANQPGVFTALIGYEWSSTPGGNNLHRNVIFADGAEKVGQVLPFSLFDGAKPEELWQYLENYENRTGGSVLAIPHNGNISNGLMFSATDFDGKNISADYAARRSRWEPLYEMTQIKGDAEVHPMLAPNDEFANYEKWDKGNLSASAVKQPQMLKHEYARSALKLGIKYEAELGVNPFKFGMIGSTDAHTGIPEAAENNYWGKLTNYEPNPNRTYNPNLESKDRGAGAKFSRQSWEFGSAGYAAVWAHENTRQSIFEAMQRREVYATTGPRISVRFFAGSKYTRKDLYSPDFVRRGYQKGVAMGADVDARRVGDRLSFMVSASKDPDGANLDRVQIIKGWLDKAGELHEKVYNVAVSDDRRIKNNKVKTLRSTVNVADASYLNTIGDVQLSALWEDPDFDPKQRAFYYARVIEIPTPRWPAYDAKFFKLELPDSVVMQIQERAYTSPIWYSPK